jgi:hypothetical protein
MLYCAGSSLKPNPKLGAPGPVLSQKLGIADAESTIGAGIDPAELTARFRVFPLFEPVTPRRQVPRLNQSSIQTS